MVGICLRYLQQHDGQTDVTIDVGDTSCRLWPEDETVPGVAILGIDGGPRFLRRRSCCRLGRTGTLQYDCS